MKIEISDAVLILLGLALLTFRYGGRIWLWFRDGGMIVDGQPPPAIQERTPTPDLLPDKPEHDRFPMAGDPLIRDSIKRSESEDVQRM